MNSYIIVRKFKSQEESYPISVGFPKSYKKTSCKVYMSLCKIRNVRKLFSAAVYSDK